MLFSEEAFTISNNSFYGKLFTQVGLLQDLGTFRRVRFPFQHPMAEIVLLPVVLCWNTEEYDISNNFFTGTIPSEIGNLQELGMFCCCCSILCMCCRLLSSHLFSLLLCSFVSTRKNFLMFLATPSREQFPPKCSIWYSLVRIVYNRCVELTCKNFRRTHLPFAFQSHVGLYRHEFDSPPSTGRVWRASFLGVLWGRLWQWSWDEMSLLYMLLSPTVFRLPLLGIFAAHVKNS